MSITFYVDSNFGSVMQLDNMVWIQQALVTKIIYGMMKLKIQKSEDE